MRSSYGKELRKFVSTRYNVPWIVNLNAVDAFDEKVYGYPSIIMITLKMKGETAHFETQRLEQLESISDVITDPESHLREPMRARQWLSEDGSPWVLGSERPKVPKGHTSGIEEQGFRIGIGVATGLDKVFIGKELRQIVEEEVLIPLVLPQDLVDGKICWTGNYIINPFEKDSPDLLKLPDYPKLHRYFNSSAGLLRKRHIAKRRPSHWYRTIDRIYPYLRDAPKLLLPDIKKNQWIVLDKGKYYPHHNVYYITGASIERLKLLGAVLMSDFVFKQIKSVSTIMHGGFVRWQSQNLRRIRIPILSEMPERVKTRLMGAFEEGKRDEIDLVLNQYIDNMGAPAIVKAGVNQKLSSEHATQVDSVLSPPRGGRQKRLLPFIESSRN